jgi:hypothetical protein
MPLPVSVSNTFAGATSAIPLSQLDGNFTVVVNAINGIGNGVNSLANVVVTGGTIANVTITNSAANLTSLNLTTPITVASGGTNLATLTANNVILGNGTNSVQFVAPGTAGFALVSNGTTWISSPPMAATSVNLQDFTASGTWTKQIGRAHV